MRFLLSGVVAAFTLVLATAPTPAAAETFECPLTTARRNIVNPLPPGWFSTPVESRLTEARIATIGGQSHMVCVYNEAGRVMREVPSGQTCVPRPGGFECGSSSGPRPEVVADVHSSGTFNVRGTYELDLDSGAEARGAQSDFWYEIARNNETYFTPRNGVTYAVMTSAEPSYAACGAATYTNARMRIEALSIGWICVRTSERHIGRFKIDGVDRFSRPRVMTLTYLTWR